VTGSAADLGEFTGKVAMVTGAARGIGQASAVAFARRGADVVVCDVLEDAAETVGLIEKLGCRALYIHTDVSDSAAVQNAVTTGVAELGRLDFAHNNAGIGPSGLTAEISETDWNRVIAVNLTGTFLCMRYQLPHLLETRGAIVNTASMWGVVGASHMAAYSASKHGVIGLTRAAALDYGTAGVRVNAIAPGPIQTALTAVVPTEMMDHIIGRTAVQRYGQPPEIGEVAAWLCSASASYVTGVVLPVDGGWLAG
jgi:NAD(P)-dependent dehydrogenase (short-subunit alcohol dehydrogenase family)